MLRNKPVPALLLAVLALCIASCQPQHPDIWLGNVIPEFTLPSLAGGDVSIDSYQGGPPVVLNFWATWCSPCVTEIPALQAIARDAGAEVVSIAIDTEGAPVVRPFVERHGIEYTVLLDDGSTFARFNGYAIPYTLVLDSSLEIVKMYRGAVSLRSLERDLVRAREG